jgi:hypothetical protein
VLAKDYRGGNYSSEIRAYLRYLSWLPRKLWIGPTLLWMVLYRSKPKKVLDFLRAMDRYAYGLLILGETNKVEQEKRYDTIVTAMRSGEVDPDQLMAFSQAEVQSICKRAQYTIGHDNLKTAKLVLLRIHVREERKARHKGVLNAAEEILQDDNNIEHILPESPAPGSDWPSLFGAEIATYYRMMGNLFIVPEDLNKNQLKNKSWKDKRGVLNAHVSNGGLLVPLANFLPLGWNGKWNRKSLEKRQLALAEAIYDLWGFRL